MRSAVVLAQAHAPRRVYAVSTTTRAQMRFLATQNGQRKLGKGSRAQTEKGFKRHLVSVKVRCSDSRRQWLMCLYLPDDIVVSNTTSARHGRYILCSISSSRDRNCSLWLAEFYSYSLTCRVGWAAILRVIKNSHIKIIVELTYNTILMGVVLYV